MNRYHLPCSAVAILLSLLLCWGAVPAIGAPIVLECLVKGVNNPDQPSIALGWKAAVVGLNSRSNWGMGSSTLTVNSSPSASIANSIYVAAAAASAIVPFGIYDDESTMAMMNAPQFSANNMVLMGPYTQSTGVRVWKDNIYFMSADPMAELIGLLNWVFSVNAAGKVRTTRIGWMFLSGGVFGTTLPTLMAAQLEMLGLPPPVSYTADVGSQFSSATFNTYMDQKPTCMFLFGARGAHTTSFFTALIQNAYVLENSKSFYVMMPFSLMYTTGAAYQTEYLKSKTSVVPMGNIRYSMPLPAPTDTTHAAVTQFQADMKTAIGQDGNALQSTSGYLMFYGWLFMQQIFYVTSTYVPYGVATLNYAAMKANMFRQNRYYLGDIVLGNYGGICPNMNTALKLGAACSCNQGGHFVAIGTISGVAAVNGDSSGVSISSVAPYYFPNNPCYTNQNVTVAYLPVNGAVVSMTSNSLASSLAAQAAAAFSGISAGEADLNAAPLTLSMTALTAATPSDASTAIATQSAQTQISVITGPVASPFLPEAMSDYLFLDPITVPTTLEPSSAPNAILLSATLRQQIFTVAGYLGSLVTQKSTLVSDGVNLRSSTLNDALVVDMVKYSLGYFNVPMRSAYGVGNTISLIDTLPTSGYTYVVGLDPKLLPALKSFLTTNTNAYVILSFDELTIYYDQFTAAFGTTSSAFMNRVLFATNVPSWTQTGTSNIFQKFVSATSAAAHTPAGMRTFLASMVALASNRQSTKTTADDMQALLYKTVTTEVDGLHFGPFVPSNAIASPPYLLSTVSNFGAQNISVWSYNRIVDPTTALLAEPVSMSVVYGNPATPIADPIVTTSTTTTTPEKATTTSTTTTTSTLPPCSLTSAPTTFPPPKTTTTTTTTVLPSKKHTQSDAWKYVLLVILGVLLVAVVLLLFRFGARVLPCFGGEPMHSAPVDSDAPTTVVFVEIEKWSDVQRAVPSAAAECIAEYRNIVRRLVEQHDCYEGGSLNDAFMVVARNPMNSLKFAGALQKKMELMQGPAVDAVDAAYADLGLSSGAVHGLHVRVGVHTDVVDIAYDVDTDHYEYRGAGCIAALRTERLANGGQVLVTGATCESLTEKQLAGVHAVSLGSQQFQEYEDPVPLFELVVLPHREFQRVSSYPVPVLVGDRVLCLCSEDVTEMDADAESTICREVLNMVYLPLSVKERISVLQGKCEEQGVMVPRSGASLSDERYSNMLLNLVAEGMSRSSTGSVGRWDKLGEKRI